MQCLPALQGTCLQVVFVCGHSVPLNSASKTLQHQTHFPAWQLMLYYVPAVPRRQAAAAHGLTMLLLTAACAGLTSLSLGEHFALEAEDMLPPSLLKLSVRDAAVDSLFPLTRLEQLALEEIGDDALPAAELRQLSAMTSLTSVDLKYHADAQAIAAAADGWSALPLQHLRLWCDDVTLQRNMLTQLSQLTRLSSLTLWDCVFEDSIQPEMLGDVLAQLTRLHTLTLSNDPQQQEQEQLAAVAAVAPGHAVAAAAGNVAAVAATAQDAAADAGSFLERMLLRLSRSFHRMQLSTLDISWGLGIGRAEAAALADMKGLRTLKLSDCDLEDCIVVDIASALCPGLDELDISVNPRVTDGCLPVLAQLVPGITKSQLSGTGITEEGLQRYLPTIKMH
jgi:hypothetical protein